ncbi:MAG: family 10 glycosylhydrolase [Nitrospirota bacterium]
MELILNVDYYDHIGFYKRLYDKKRIEWLLKKCKQTGAKTIFWRVSVCGQVAYHSQVRTMFNGGLENNHPGNKLANILKEFDPLQVACEIAHKLDLKIYPWVTLFDDYYPGLESEFSIKHPEYLFVSRDGKEYFKGVLCYAYPQVRAHRLLEIKELANYDIDGIYLCTRSHAGHSESSREADKFGYNQPVVQEYERRYGINILNEDFDKGLWYELQGEYFTLFLHEAKKELKNIALCVGINHQDDLSIPGATPMARLKFNWKQWINDGTVDELVFGVGQDLWEWHGKNWTTCFDKEYKNFYDKCRIYAWFLLWDFMGKYPEQKIPVLPTKPKKVIKEMVNSINSSQSIYQASLSGAVLHETVNLQAYRYWDIISI